MSLQYNFELGVEKTDRKNKKGQKSPLLFK